MTDDIRAHILGVAKDAGRDFAYYDRREDEDLGPEQFESALRAETVTRSEVATAFVKGIDESIGLSPESDPVRYESVLSGVESVRSAFRSEDADPDADGVPDDWSLSDRVSYALGIPIRYAYADGDHHKKWIIDQMIRILVGPEGHAEFVRLYNNGPEGPETYDWSENVVAP